MDIDIDKIVKENSKSNFFYSFSFLPGHKQKAINIIYSFCQISDEIADCSLPADIKRKNLEEWRAELNMAFSSSSSIDILNKTFTTAKKFNIPKTLFFELLEGMEMDLNNRRFKNYAELEVYCYKVASVVGLMTSKIFGYRNPETEKYAITLGKAFQITNILRDVKNDYKMGRVYLPYDDLSRFGITETDIAKGVMTDSLYSLLSEYYQKALNYYAEAETLLHPPDRKNFKAALIMKNIYFAILKKIKARNLDVFNYSFKLSKFEKIRISLSTFLFYK